MRASKAWAERGPDTRTTATPAGPALPVASAKIVSWEEEVEVEVAAAGLSGFGEVTNPGRLGGFAAAVLPGALELPLSAAAAAAVVAGVGVAESGGDGGCGGCVVDAARNEEYRPLGWDGPLVDLAGLRCPASGGDDGAAAESAARLRQQPPR